MKRHFLYAILSVLFPSVAIAGWQATVVDVVDGDTLIVMESESRRAEIIQLYGADCPEKEQAYGLKAKSYTLNLLYGESIEVMPIDSGGIVSCVVYVGDVCINEKLLRAGYAWYHGNDPRYMKWAGLQEKAKGEKKGLWSQEAPVPPWEFRNAEKSDSALEQAHTIEMPSGRHKSIRSRAVRGGRVYRMRTK